MPTMSEQRIKKLQRKIRQEVKTKQRVTSLDLQRSLNIDQPVVSMIVRKLIERGEVAIVDKLVATNGRRMVHVYGPTEKYLGRLQYSRDYTRAYTESHNKEESSRETEMPITMYEVIPAQVIRKPWYKRVAAWLTGDSDIQEIRA